MKSKNRIVILGVVAVAMILVLVSKTDSHGIEPVNAAPMPQTAMLVKAAQAAVPAQTKMDPLDIADLYRSADELVNAGRLPEAVAAYEKVIAHQPSLGETYLRLGLLYFKLKLPTKAEEFYLKAVSYGIDDPEVYFHLGYMEEARGALDLALANYLKAEAKGSRNPELFYNIGNAYAQLTKRAEAITYYKRAVSINPEHMNAFVNLSVVSFQLELYADARFYLDKASALGYKAEPQYIKVLSEKK
jgi:tetratricopeptide (TPR) repeat protein